MDPKTWPTDPKNPKILKIFEIIFLNFLENINNDTKDLFRFIVSVDYLKPIWGQKNLKMPKKS